MTIISIISVTVKTIYYIVFTVTEQKSKSKAIQWKKLTNYDVIEDK